MRREAVTEMERRVRDAIMDALDCDRSDNGHYLNVARAAIRAMADAPDDFLGHIAGYFMTPRNRLPIVWKAFIDAASPPE